MKTVQAAVSNGDRKQIGTPEKHGEISFETLGDAVTKKRVTPLQMVLHVLDHAGKVRQINAMHDTGSTHNIMERSAMLELGLGGDCV